MNDQQIIIFEGLDMSGKTTILNALSGVLNIPAYKEIRQEKWYDHVIDLLYAEEARLQLIEQIGFSIIFDRSYPSEFVYAHSYGRQTIDDKIWEFDERYAKLGAKIIICSKDSSKFQDDKTALIDRDKYTTIASNYYVFSRMTKCKVLQLDTSSENLEWEINKILEFIKE